MTNTIFLFHIKLINGGQKTSQRHAVYFEMEWAMAAKENAIKAASLLFVVIFLFLRFCSQHIKAISQKHPWNIRLLHVIFVHQLNVATGRFLEKVVCEQFVSKSMRQLPTSAGHIYYIYECERLFAISMSNSEFSLMQHQRPVCRPVGDWSTESMLLRNWI